MRFIKSNTEIKGDAATEIGNERWRGRRKRAEQWRSNRGFSRFKEPGPPTVRGPDRESRETRNEHKSYA